MKNNIESADRMALQRQADPNQNDERHVEWLIYLFIRLQGSGQRLTSEEKMNAGHGRGPNLDAAMEVSNFMARRNVLTA